MIIIDKDKLKLIMLLITIILGFLSYFICMGYAIITNDRDLIALCLIIAIPAVAISIISITDK